MSNKALIIIVWVSLVGIIAGMMVEQFKTPITFSDNQPIFTTTYEFSLSSGLINFFGGVFLLTGVYLLLKNGTFIKSKPYRFWGLAFALTILGVLFNIMHWSFGAQLLLTGLISIFLIYTAHFIQKPLKSWLDWGKWLFIFLFILGKIISGNHWPYGQEIDLLAYLLFIIVLFRYIHETGLTRKSSS